MQGSLDDRSKGIEPSDHEYGGLKGEFKSFGQYLHNHQDSGETNLGFYRAHRAAWPAEEPGFPI